MGTCHGSLALGVPFPCAVTGRIRAHAHRKGQIMTYR